MKNEYDKEQLKKNIKQGIHTCLVDPFNVSLPYLREFASRNPKAILFEDTKLTKDWLMQIIQKQHEAKILKISELKDACGLSWEKVVKKLSNASMDKLTEIASTSFKKGYVLLLLNPQITKTKISLLEKLSHNITIVIVVKDSHITSDLPSIFQIINIPNPLTQDVRAFIKRNLKKDKVEDAEFLENKLLFLSGNEPENISKLLSGLSHKEYITIEGIRGLQPLPGMIPKINMTPIIAIIAAVFVAIRGIALGKNDPDLYIVGAVGATVLFMLFRFLDRGSIE